MPVLLREVGGDEYKVHERICFILFIYAMHATVGDHPGLAVKLAAPVPDNDVSAVGESVETVLPALGDDDVLD